MFLPLHIFFSFFFFAFLIVGACRGLGHLGALAGLRLAVVLVEGPVVELTLRFLYKVRRDITGEEVDVGL